MAILVTGGAGFIGSHLLERLHDETDEELVCLDNFDPFYAPARKYRNLKQLLTSRRFDLVKADLSDSDAVSWLFQQYAIEHVFHAGALAGVRPSVDNPLAYERTNVAGTLVLLEAVRLHPVRRFLFFSSATVYGSGCRAPFRETDPLGEVASPYGATKRAGENLCLLYHRLHGVPTVALRLFSVYGPRLRPDLALSRFVQAIARDQSLPLIGDGSQKRDFTNIADILDGILAAWRSDLVGQAINFGHNEPISIRHLIELIETEFGKRAQVETAPSHPADVPLTCADLNKAAQLLQYRPRVSIDEGVREFVSWYRATHP
jgi:UDP-glucuronate 4-epimerase